MQISGIIAEFNPFHLGHEYIIQAEKSKGNAVIAVMSGNFVQRGDTAVFPKEFRAAAAIKAGADLVIELPVVWANLGAQSFAKGAISLLNSLNIVNTVVFGSECGEIEHIKIAADTLKNAETSEAFKKALNTGKTFAAARSEAANLLYPEIAELLNSPNDTLGIEYIRQAELLNTTFNFECYKRIGVNHDSGCNNNFASGSYIREQILNGNFANVKKYMPDYAVEIFKNAPFSNINALNTTMLYALRLMKDEIKNLPDISEGLENRILEAVQKATTTEELLNLIKSKRYTMARIRRIIIAALIKQTAEISGGIPPYIRVLGFSKTGELLLSKISKTSALPIITCAADLSKLDSYGRTIWETECRATDIYSLSLNIPQGCGKEYYHKIIKGEL